MLYPQCRVLRFSIKVTLQITTLLFFLFIKINSEHHKKNPQHKYCWKISYICCILCLFCIWKRVVYYVGQMIFKPTEISLYRFKSLSMQISNVLHCKKSAIKNKKKNLETLKTFFFYICLLVYTTSI